MFYDIVYRICSFIVQLHSFNSRQINRQADIACFDYFKVTILWKRQFAKNRSFTNFCSWDQKNDS